MGAWEGVDAPLPRSFDSNIVTHRAVMFRWPPPLGDVGGRACAVDLHWRRVVVSRAA